MRVVLQRVSQARVVVNERQVGAIERGLVVFVGVAKGDREEDARHLADKLIHLRIFPDERGQMNLSLKDVNGSALIVSQFTLYGDCRKGRRPSFSLASSADEAKVLYDFFIKEVRNTGLYVATGVFQAEMQVSLTNEGPVTLILETNRVDPISYS
jgi:D-tyrosyl-tRNA(Tyr) deacylase